MKERIGIKCGTCGELFWVVPSLLTRNYCSRRCGHYRGVDRDAIVQAALRGEALTEVAARLGITRERARQIANMYLTPVQRRELRRAVAKEAKAVIAEKKLARTKAGALPCLVCYAPVTRSHTAKTCSPTCARLWVRARLQIDPLAKAKWRRAMATSILTNMHGDDPATVAKRKWATRLLSGVTDFRPSGGGPREGSDASECAALVREMRTAISQPQELER